jgi:hypothetical protein
MSLPLRAVDRAGLRASDADRERAVELLQGHAEAGRLTVEELDERCSRALSAKTFGELDAITSDLPPLAVVPEAPPSAAVQPARRRRRGRYFSGSWRVPASPERAMHDLLTQVAPVLHDSGYELQERTPYRLRFVRSRRPVWTFAVAILVFPFGLLALLYTEERHVAIELQPGGGGTLVTAAGVAPPDVHDAFRRLEA